MVNPTSAMIGATDTQPRSFDSSLTGSGLQVVNAQGTLDSAATANAIFMQANGDSAAALHLAQNTGDNLPPLQRGAVQRELRLVASNADAVATMPDEADIPSYQGDLPSPLQVMWYVPEGNEVLKPHFSDSEIRGWVADAAEYHGVPHAMLATVLGQENPPGSSKFRQFLQFGERTVTTGAAIVDDALFDVVPDAISRGSSGFANMSYATLQSAAAYTEQHYGRNPMPDEVRYRVGGYDQDTRIPGDDYKADLYYAASHVRELIDRETGVTGFDGELTPEQVRGVFRRYNGSGPLAERYADDAMQRIENAKTGAEPLYFYER